jgi:hypothetical protein
MLELCTGHGTPMFGCGETYNQTLNFCPYCGVKNESVIVATENPETKSCFGYQISFGGNYSLQRSR